MLFNEIITQIYTTNTIYTTETSKKIVMYSPIYSPLAKYDIYNKTKIGVGKIFLKKMIN